MLCPRCGKTMLYTPKTNQKNIVIDSEIKYSHEELWSCKRGCCKYVIHVSSDTQKAINTYKVNSIEWHKLNLWDIRLKKAKVILEIGALKQESSDLENEIRLLQTQIICAERNGREFFDKTKFKVKVNR